jgi:hypothetical protein
MPLLVLHAHTYRHSHHRGNVTAPDGRPSLRSRLHFGHNQEGGGGQRSLYGHVVVLEKKHVQNTSGFPKTRDGTQVSESDHVFVFW